VLIQSSYQHPLSQSFGRRLGAASVEVIVNQNFVRRLAALALTGGLLLPAGAHNLAPKNFKDLKDASKNFKHASSANLEKKPARVRLNGPLPPFAVRDVYGKGYTRESFKGKFTMFLLADTQCPCVQAVEKRISDLSKKYGPQGLRPVYVFSLPDERPLQIARFMQEHQIPFPALLDQKQGLLKVLDGQCSSEVYLFDKAGLLRYHGRVDDSTFDPKTVKSRDLENAIVAVTKGKRVLKPEVPAMGCAIPRI
jgi:cytochrome oxidase Cu insertion factor (SCO1/SenC/PrrC family)